VHLEMKRQVNSENDNMDTQISDSNQAHLEMERNAYQEESLRAHPTIADDMCTEHSADVKCTYKCTDLEDDQCDCKSTREMMRRSSSLGLCRTSAIMSTEAVPNETENDLQTCHIVYRTALPETVTEGIMRQTRQLPTDDYQIALHGGCRNLV